MLKRILQKIFSRRERISRYTRSILDRDLSDIRNDPPQRFSSLTRPPNTIPLTDKPRAEKAILSIYEHAGLDAPHIIWTESPLANVFAKMAIDLFSENNRKFSWLYEWLDDAPWNNFIRGRAWQCVIDSGWKIGDTETGPPVWHGIQIYRSSVGAKWGEIQSTHGQKPLVGSPEWVSQISVNSFWRTVEDSVEHSSTLDWLLHFWFFNLRAKRLLSSHNEDQTLDFEEDRERLYTQKNLSALPIKIFDAKRHKIIQLRMRTDFEALRHSAGWVMPFKHICFVSAQHTQLHLDDRGTLHCETGPAMTYPDGFAMTAWHGIQFPDDWVKAKPSAKEILQLRGTEERRIACEMVGWKAILRELGTSTIDKDENPEIGELVSVKLPSFRDEKFLKVTCATGRKFIMPVPPEMRTARQANAWTWGLEPDEYKPEVRT